MTIKQNHPPEGYAFTNVEQHILNALHIQYKDIITDWQSGSRGHWDPVFTRAIPITEIQRAEINQQYYNRTVKHQISAINRHHVVPTPSVPTLSVIELYNKRKQIIANRHTKGISARKQSRKLHKMEREYPELLLFTMVSFCRVS